MGTSKLHGMASLLRSKQSYHPGSGSRGHLFHSHDESYAKQPSMPAISCKRWLLRMLEVLTIPLSFLLNTDTHKQET